MTLSAEQRIALSDLVHRYAAYVDDREFGAVAELFTADGELVVPAPPADLRPIHSHRGPEANTTAAAAVAARPRLACWQQIMRTLTANLTYSYLRRKSWFSLGRCG